MTLSPQVERVILWEGLGRGELEEMLRLSAPFTGPEGFNRRFHRWMFKVNGQTVEGMKTFSMRQVGVPSDRGHMEDPCDGCDGDGCPKCGWHGSIIRHL